MSRSLARRLEKLEARYAAPEEDLGATATDAEWSAVARLRHELRAGERTPSGGPVSDAEWSELQQDAPAGRDA